jgi:hypothetical protein
MQLEVYGSYGCTKGLDCAGEWKVIESVSFVLPAGESEECTNWLEKRLGDEQRMAAALVSMLISAATEQCAIRGGAEITLQDVARAVTLVTPVLSPISAEVRTLDAPELPLARPLQSADARRFFKRLFDAEGDADDSLLPSAVASLDPKEFRFRSVQTAWVWRTRSNAVIKDLGNQGGASVRHSRHSENG